MRHEIRALGWPLKYRGRLLGIVIRQWAEDDPSSIFAGQLAESDEIKSFITYARTSGQFTGEGGRENVESSIALKLQDFGLPYNPTIAKHVYALVNGLPPPLPARGVLVTTLGYLTKPFDDLNIKPTSWQFGPPHDAIIEGVNQWITADLLLRAHKLVKRHREFLEAFGPYPLTESRFTHQLVYDRSLRPLHRGKGTLLDYEEEAVRTLSEINMKHLNGISGGITEHLGKVYHRVRAARTRAHLEPKPPDDWTVRARQRIDALLSAKT